MWCKQCRQDMEASDVSIDIRMDCHGCGVSIQVPTTWAQPGVLALQPPQVRVQILEYDENMKQLVEATSSPDLTRLVLCDRCRPDFIHDMIESLLRLRERRAPTVRVM